MICWRILSSRARVASTSRELARSGREDTMDDIRVLVVRAVWIRLPWARGWGWAWIRVWILICERGFMGIGNDGLFEGIGSLSMSVENLGYVILCMGVCGGSRWRHVGKRGDSLAGARADGGRMY
eukprot:1330997-Amorphochlora_amoeboformis.AAC.2